MKTLVTAAAVAALALGSAPAFATASPSDTQTYAFTANVQKACTISGASSTDLGALTAADGSWSPAHANQNVDDTGAFCNAAGTKATVTHVALTNSTTSPVPSTFTNVVDFTPSVTTTGGGSILSDTGSTAVALGAFTGLTVHTALIQPTLHLVSGSYSGSITVTLFAAD